MSKKCARCDKTVYPIEELKCLDKVWHKGCFKCQECGMTLSMKTYKGYNKLPYCEAHIPKAKATTVAETPEMKRLAENTKIQSNVQYHADFEKNKARFTQIADDPETKRIQQNTKNISNVTYHGDLEKKAKMESRRDTDGDEQEREVVVQPPRQEPVPVQQPQMPAQYPQKQQQSQPPQYRVQQPASPSYPGHYSQQQQHNQQPQPSHLHSQQFNQPIRQHQPPQYNQQHSQPPQHHNQPSYTYQSYPHQQHSHSHQPSRHQHNTPQYPTNQTYLQDPNHNSPYSQRNSSQTLIYSSQTGPVSQGGQNVGSIADYDPLNNQFGSISQPRHGGYAQEHKFVSAQSQRNHYPRDAGMGQQSHHMGHMQQQKISAPPTNLGKCYRAIYDYEAADSDEVSFKDGDLIINCTSIDEGWMTGTVQRSGRTGMLPANYVERVS